MCGGNQAGDVARGRRGSPTEREPGERVHPVKVRERARAKPC